MNTLQHLPETLPSLLPLIIILIVWETIWKLIAMWRAGRNNQLVWFICLALINTVGILPIIYLLIHKRKSAIEKASPAQL